LPSLSDSHLLFKSRSARTTLIRFNFAMIDYCCLTAKLRKIIETNADMLKKLHKQAKIWLKDQSFDEYITIFMLYYI
jgi:hypothetical protein